MSWTCINNATVDRPELPPAGIYVLASDGDKVTMARYMPRKKEWVFPCATGKLDTVTHWTYFPIPPNVLALCKEKV